MTSLKRVYVRARTAVLDQQCTANSSSAWRDRGAAPRGEGRRALLEWLRVQPQ